MSLPPFPNAQNNAAGATPVYVVGQPVTYLAPVNSAVAVGGTPVIVFAAGTIVNGATITNPSTATEALFVNAVSNATTTPAGTNFALAAGASFSFLPSAVAVTANAVTNGHAFSAVSW